MKALENYITRRAVGARERQAAERERDREVFAEIDKRVDRGAKQSMKAEDKRWIRKVQTVAHWTSEEINQHIDKKA